MEGEKRKMEMGRGGVKGMGCEVDVEDILACV